MILRGAMQVLVKISEHEYNTIMEALKIANTEGPRIP